MAKAYADTTRTISSFDGTEVIVVQDGTSAAPTGLAEMKKTTLADIRTYMQDGIAHALVYKGSCTYAQLTALTDMNTGDMWNVTDKDGQNYAWNGSAWDALGETLDISGKADKSEVEADKAELEGEIALKADQSTTYTKTETDTALALKADKTEVQTIASESVSRDEAIKAKIGHYDLTEVDENSTFILDGDSEAEMAELIAKTPAYEQDAIMLSLEPDVPTSGAHNFGLKGQIAIDDDYLYVCTAENTWKKIALEAL